MSEQLIAMSKENDALVDENRELRAKLATVVHALRSYQYGNAEPDLAREVADAAEVVGMDCKCRDFGGDNKHSPECAMRQMLRLRKELDPDAPDAIVIPSTASGWLECPMCGRDKAFMINAMDDSKGYCRFEGKVWSIKAAALSKYDSGHDCGEDTCVCVD